MRTAGPYWSTLDHKADIVLEGSRSMDVHTDELTVLVHPGIGIITSAERSALSARSVYKPHRWEDSILHVISSVQMVEEECKESYFRHDTGRFDRVNMGLPSIEHLLAFTHSMVSSCVFLDISINTRSQRCQLALSAPHQRSTWNE